MLLIGLGVFLVRVGLEDANQWASVFGLFLNIAGFGVAVLGAVQARRAATRASAPVGGGDDTTNRIHGGKFTGAVTQGRDIYASVDVPSPTLPEAGRAPETGSVSNHIEGGTFGGPVIQGRDVVLPPPADRRTDPS
ncbi:hypothetical protein [Micromonospora chokoriensis]|uniref:hypothetical protein n=1 Tax=Micromonospora chokoriensis TaxID=356851 RepID=UPI000B5B09EA|nr:hypothetical protein [Micromonospora chokoriensis]